MSESIELGSYVADVITGYSGVVIAITHWLYGCVRAGVQSKKLKEDGTFPEAVWFDIKQLFIVEEEIIEEKETKVYGDTIGGDPYLKPERARDPKSF